MMILPEGMTEDEAVEVIYKVVNTLAAKFRFGYHSVEDMKQEGAKFAIQALNKPGAYDPTRPLENFLYRHIRNRLINHRRDKYIRNEPPCKGCVFFDPKYKKSKNQCGAFEEKDECKKISDWKNRNNAKQAIMRPVDISSIGDDAFHNENNFLDSLSFNEIKLLIDKELSVDLRSDYLRMIEGVTIPKARRQRVREAVLAILEKNHGQEETYS